MLGIVAGLAGLIGFGFFQTSGFTPAMADTANAIAWVNANLGRLRITIFFYLVSIGAAAIFVAGLAEKLRARTPTRAAATLYLYLLGLAGFGIGSLLFGGSLPAIAALPDRVAASHAWTAVSAVNVATGGFGNLFTGSATLLAGWAIVESNALSVALGYFGLLVGIVSVLGVLVPHQLLVLGGSFLPALWLIWSGSALRRSM
jgi:hypothetical protein